MRAGRCGAMADGAVVRTLPAILTILTVFACARGRQPSFQGLGGLGGGQLWPQTEVAIECWPARNEFGRRVGHIPQGWHRTSEYLGHGTPAERAEPVALWIVTGRFGEGGKAAQA